MNRLDGTEVETESVEFADVLYDRFICWLIECGYRRS